MSGERALRAVTQARTGPLLRIVSYNVLANKYAMSGYHDYCPQEYRRWDYRLPRLCQEISNLKGDIVCLQEVEDKVFTEEIGRQLMQDGFQVRI